MLDLGFLNKNIKKLLHAYMDVNELDTPFNCLLVSFTRILIRNFMNGWMMGIHMIGLRAIICVRIAGRLVIFCPEFAIPGFLD